MTAINAVADLAIEGDIAILTLNSPPVNALSAAVRAGILDGVKLAIADSNVKGIVLTCAGKTFIAGADISHSQTRFWPSAGSSARTICMTGQP